MTMNTIQSLVGRAGSARRAVTVWPSLVGRDRRARRLAVPILAVLLTSSLLIHPSAAAIPAATQKEIEQLVQQNKFTDALAKVDALLKANPADKDLLDLKAQLEKSAKLPAPAAGAPAKMTDEDRLEANTVNRLMVKIRESTDPADRKKMQEQVLEHTAPLVQKYPQELNLWQVRAIAALALDKPRDGWEAGKNLKALGAMSSTDPALSDVMSELNLKGWLKMDEAQIKEAETKVTEGEATKLLSKLWQGTWKLAKKDTSTYGQWDASHTVEIILSIDAGAGEPQLHYQVEENDSRNNHAHSNGLRMEQTNHFKLEAPGNSSYEHNTRAAGKDYSTGGYVDQPPTSVTGSGDIDLVKPRFERAAKILLFETRGSIKTLSNEGKQDSMSLSKVYTFYYAPEVKDALVPLSEDDMKLSEEQLRKKLNELKDDDLMLRQGTTPPELELYLKLNKSK
jgi:protein involved in temperature-dependent protein secretion